MAYTFAIVSSAIPRAEVVGFRGKEAVSAPFALCVLLRVEAPLVDTARLVHTSMALEISGYVGVPHRIAGIVSRAGVLHVDARGALVEAEIVPPFARLALSRHNRIFTDVTIPEVLQAVFREEPLLDFELRLSSSYSKREHVAQHRESNLAFVSRWMEREGMFYFFEHTGDHGRLIVADQPGAFGVSLREPVPYRPEQDGGALQSEAFFELAQRRVLRPQRVAITDYNYRTPRLSLRGERDVAASSPAAIVRHGDHVLTPAEALQRAEIEAEGLRATERTYRARGPVTRLVSGHRFVADDHPRWGSEELVALEIVHEGALVDRPEDHAAIQHLALPRQHTYQASVVAIPASAPFRPKRVTAWPVVPGLVDATIDGPAGSPYAQIDAEGRYKVRFKLDEGDPVDGSTSTWVRMVQPHGGSVEGWHFPLRKGTEVHVAFAYGDPDRPIIVGCAPNPDKPSVVTQANHTQNVIMTGGSNRIEIEDQAGAQRIDTSTPTQDSYLHLGAGEYQIEGNTNGQGWLSTGADLEITVDGAKTENVLANVLETYKSTQTVDVTGPVTEKLATSRHTTTLGPVTNKYAGPLTEQVVGAVTEHYQSALTTAVAASTKIVSDAAHTLTVLAGSTETYGGSQDTEVTGTLTHTVTGTVKETFLGTSTRTTGGFYTLICDGDMTVHATTFEGNVASWNNIDSAAKAFIEDNVIDATGKKTELALMDTSLTGARLDIWLDIKQKALLRFGITALQLKVCVKHLQTSTIHIRNHPTHKEMKLIGKVKTSLCLMI